MKTLTSSALPPVILSVPPSSNHTSSLLLLSFCQKWLLKFLHHACSRFFTFFSAVCLLTVPFHCLTGLFIFHSNCTSFQHSVCSKGTNNQSVLYLYSLFIYTVNEVTQSIKADPFLQESLCHPHRNNYFTAVLFQITSTWIHLCYSDIWCVTRKKFSRVLHTHNHLWSQDECTDRLRRRNVSADSRCLTRTVEGLQMICVQLINVNRLQSLCPWSHTENSTLFVPAELSPGYFLVQQENLLRTNGLFK